MKHTVFILAALVFALPVFAQIIRDTAPIVQEDDPHFATLAEHQAQITDRYDRGKRALPSFGNWVRVESESTARLFPKLSFYSISWGEARHPDAEGRFVNLAGFLGKTLAINTDTGVIEAELSFYGNYEAFGKLLVENGIVLESHADAERIWNAFCEIHHRYRRYIPFKRVNDTTWHLGISSYDQTISVIDKTKTVVTRTHYRQVIVDRESKQILSWESKVDTSNQRTLIMD